MENEDKDWLDYRAMFADVYDSSNYETSIQSAAMRAGHRLAERGFASSEHFSKVLEVGSGTGEHLSFVNHTFDRYVLTDLDENALKLAEFKLGARYGDRLSFEKQNGQVLNYENNTFDRLIAAHVLEHIYEPHLALKEWRRVLKSGGVLSILIPTDPGMAWRLGRHFGPRRKAIAIGVRYDYIMAREHVNSCSNLIALLRYYFPQSKECWWPFPIKSMDLNLFFVYHATVNK